MRTLIVGLGWLSPFVPIVLWPHTRIYGFVIMAALHALWLYPTLTANVQWFGPVVTHFSTEAREWRGFGAQKRVKGYCFHGSRSLPRRN